MDTRPNRKTIRLKCYDYRSAGVYHVTICARNRECIFGSIVNGSAILNNLGQVAYHNAELIPSRYPESRVIAFVIMPNHVHLLLELESVTDANYGVPTGAHSLSQIVRAYKASVSRELGVPIWQPRFYEHIIRGERDYLDTIEYIRDNPAAWEKDGYYMPPSP